MSKTTEIYTIVSDIEIPTHDISIRLYWTGGWWDDDPSSSTDSVTLVDAQREAMIAKSYNPHAKIQILRINTTTNEKYYEVKA